VNQALKSKFLAPIAKFLRLCFLRPTVQRNHWCVLIGRNDKVALAFAINNSTGRMLTNKRIVWSFDHNQCDQINPKPIPAFIAMGFDVDAMQAHLPDCRICAWKNRFDFAGTHCCMRTESERLEKLFQQYKW